MVEKLPDIHLLLLIGERAKRARRYLVMFMEVRDIYNIYMRLFLIRMCALSVLRIKFELRNGILSSLAVKVPVEVAVEVASSSLLFTSFALYSFSNKPVLDYTSSQHGTNQYWFIINKKI